MNINTTVGSVEIKLSDSRIKELDIKAQIILNEDVIASCTPLVPKGASGDLRSNGRPYPHAWSGEVIWDEPYAHFQYVGLVRTDETGRTWVGRGERKPILTDRPLKYQEPTAKPEWFEEAKRRDGKRWIKDVKKVYKN